MKDIILIATHGRCGNNIKNIIKECQPHGEVIVLADEEQNDLGCEVQIYPNKGYDFGKIYGFLSSYKGELASLTITNDTICPLGDFTPMFEKSKDYDFFGATDAYTDHWSLKDINGRHIQSFFHIFRGEAIQKLKDYYAIHKIVKDKIDGVLVYEMGISKLMKQSNMKCGVFMSIDELSEKYGRERYDQKIYATLRRRVSLKQGELNGTFMYPMKYIESGLPFVKNSMFQYDLRPYNLLVRLAQQVIEIAPGRFWGYFNAIFELLGLDKHARRFITSMSEIIYSHKRNDQGKNLSSETEKE